VGQPACGGLALCRANCQFDSPGQLLVCLMILSSNDYIISIFAPRYCGIQIDFDAVNHATSGGSDGVRASAVIIPILTPGSREAYA
jgi:hypothetical protein